MVGRTTKPISPEQAKRRLRVLAATTSPVAWIRRHPREGLAFGFLAGLMYGAFPDTRRATARGILRLLSGSLWHVIARHE